MRKKIFSKVGPGGGGQKRRRRRRTPSGMSSRGGGAAVASLPKMTTNQFPEFPNDFQREFPNEGFQALAAQVEKVSEARLDLRYLQSSVYALAKRGVDIFASLIALGIFGLMLPLLTLIIKLDSPGPVFYSQERVGLNRRRDRRR